MFRVVGGESNVIQVVLISNEIVCGTREIEAGAKELRKGVLKTLHGGTFH